MQKTLAVINLKTLINNALYVKSLIGGKAFYAVVKADGYGHGGAEVALAVEEIADGFCVAITDEGAALRLAGISKPVLVLTPPLDADDISRGEFYNLTFTVNSLRTAKMIGGNPCHIKVNTGMNRFGCDLRELAKILDVLSADQIAGVYSHMYNPSDNAACLKQLEIYNKAEKLVKFRNPYALSHFAASGGILAGERFFKDGVRCGILLYGYAPEGFLADVLPIMKIYARRAQSTRFTDGGIGYMRAEKNYKNLNIYRLGYADGFSRRVSLGEGPLCMDSFISEDCESLKDGGELKLVLSDAAAYAKLCGTIPYEVLCSAAKRAERVYVYDD